MDVVVGHHLDPFRSGVARFNETLAGRLGVPVMGLLDGRLPAFSRPLLSFKPAELSEGEGEALRDILRSMPEDVAPALFLHEYLDLPLERELLDRAEVAFCGNAEILARVAPLARRAEPAWAPGLIFDRRPFEATALSVFSFGMAHKVRTDMFARLKRLLERSGRTYALYVSHANHETATLEDAQSVYEEMHEVFPRGLYFMGSLSDVAVSNALTRTTFFATFFRGGVRANNTSVASAMEHGAVVVTNLDEHSPGYLSHMDNVIDIERCERLPEDAAVLEGIGARAAETARELSWDRLVTALGARAEA